MSTPTDDTRTAAALAGIQRLSGLPAERLDVQVTAGTSGGDEFTVTSDGDVLRVRATTPAVALAGYAQFVRGTGVGSVSRSGVRRPTALPAGASTAARTRYQRRVAYNITVGGYTTPFFDWPEWERELDLLAASGVNAAHLTLGQEAVWLHAFAEFGYTEAELLGWIVPPSHQPWQWLNNIQHFGGGTTRGIIDRRVALARRVLARMAELEITPILPGFSGTVPDGFAERNPGAVVVPQGLWFMDVAGPRRPDWLSSETADYGRVAEAFYRTQRELFGRSGWWAVDLLHEGGKTGGVALPDAARGVERAMRTADPDYVWVVQAWAGNPRQELLDALDTGHLLVLDLIGEHWQKAGGYGGTPWAYGILPNYGGRNGLYGDLTAIAAAPQLLAADDPAVGNLVGLTDMAEGVANNPVVWDLFHDLTWTTDPIDLDTWTDRWIQARYGVLTDAARTAWDVLRRYAYGPWRIAETEPVTKEGMLAVLNTPVDAATLDSVEAPTSMLPVPDGEESAAALEMFEFYASTDSVIAAVPSLSANQASSMGPRVLPYPPAALRPALAALVEAAEQGPRTASLDHDLVDVARQVLTDHARELLPPLRAAYGTGDLAAFEAASQRFLELIDTLDTVLASSPEFRLDTWVEAARAAGETPQEQAQLVEWAKRLITSWGGREDFVLSEYSNREWSGLVGTYYRHRWALWFDELRKVLRGEPTTPVDWYSVAEEWVTDDRPVAAPAALTPLAAAQTALAFTAEVPAARG
jgi:alpha-N-acetylglucosaminidase